MEKQFNATKDIDIKITNNIALLTVPDNEGRGKVEKHKTVKLDTLIQAFQKFGLGIETPILPRGCIKYKERGGNTTLILAHPPTKFDAIVAGNRYNNVADRKFENCPRPAVLMCYDLRKNEDNSFYLNNTRAYCIKDDLMLINNKTHVYCLPFPNIGEDGWVCWGGNSIGANYKSLIGLEMLVNVLFSTPFNNDLFRSHSFRDIGITNPVELFTHLSGKDVFPDGLFVGSSRVNNFTIGDL